LKRNTVEPFLNDPSRKRQCVNYLSTGDIVKPLKFPRNNAFKTSERRQPLNKEQNGLILYCPQIVLSWRFYCRPGGRQDFTFTRAYWRAF